MKIVETISAVREEVGKAKKNNKSVGFVPTMGFLHEGHLSLVKISKEQTDFTVMSIFVNKMQFNDLSDFESYPRETQRDIELAEKAGVDLLFMPRDSEMYHHNLTTVMVSDITDNLCGAHRPGHFNGVFTVVTKLFHIVQPDISVFGQKDIQQVTGIKKMVADLNFPLEIIVAPIVREEDGLAMSSRNKHLSPEERQRALVLNSSLKKAREMFLSGERNSSTISRAMKDEIDKGHPSSIDYISIVGADNLQNVNVVNKDAVVAVAASWGQTRLIDNMLVYLKEDGVQCVL